MAMKKMLFSDIDTPDKVLKRSFVSKMIIPFEVLMGDLTVYVSNKQQKSDLFWTCVLVKRLPACRIAHFGEICGYKYLVDAANKYPQDAEVAKHICLALNRCAIEDDKTRELCMLNGCVELVLDIARRFLPTWLDKQVHEDVRVENACTVHAALAALSCLTINNKNTAKKRCLANDGARILFQALETFSDGPAAFVTPACIALNNIVKDPSCESLCKEYDDLVSSLIAKFQDGPTYSVSELTKLLYFMHNHGGPDKGVIMLTKLLEDHVDGPEPLLCGALDVLASCTDVNHVDITTSFDDAALGATIKLFTKHRQCGSPLLLGLICNVLHNATSDLRPNFAARQTLCQPIVQDLFGLVRLLSGSHTNEFRMACHALAGVCMNNQPNRACITASQMQVLADLSKVQTDDEIRLVLCGICNEEK